MQSFFPGFIRRKRVIGAVFGVCASLFLLNYYLEGGVSSLLGDSGSSKPFNEFQGLIYYLTKSDKLLPAQLDGLEPQAPEVWSGGKHLTENEWDAHLTIMRHQYPVVVFSKTYCPYSKRAKEILAEYDLKKPAVYIEADIRPDGPKIKALLSRITGQATFPNVVVGGKSLGGADRLSILHESGALKKKLKAAGAL